MSEFARCHYGYIQIPPVTLSVPTDQKLPKKKKVTGFTLSTRRSLYHPQSNGRFAGFYPLVKDAKKFGIDIIPDYTFNLWESGGVVKMTWIIPLLIYDEDQ